MEPRHRRFDSRYNGFFFLRVGLVRTEYDSHIYWEDRESLQ